MQERANYESIGGLVVHPDKMPALGRAGVIPVPGTGVIPVIPGTGLTVEDAKKLIPLLQSLIGQLNVTDDLPTSVQTSVSRVNAILAGPGPLELDMRPRSVEVIGDPALHAKALAEAKAKEIGRVERAQLEDKRMSEVMAGVPGHVLNAASRYDAAHIAHLEAVERAYREGSNHTAQAFAESSLWFIIGMRLKAAWSKLWK
jgi:hypothetical protein